MKSNKWFKLFLLCLYSISALIYLYLFFQGRSFYFTPFSLRPHHKLFRTLRPGGTRGHGYGVIGSMMMLVMLLYSARKRWKSLHRLGPISYWLHIHIYLGIFGPLLVILHTSFKVHGLIAVSFWSMIAVALSGIVGRYLYLQIPRNLRGEELNMSELKELEQEFELQLKNEFQLDAGKIQFIEHQLVGNRSSEPGFLTVLFRELFDDLIFRLKAKKFKKALMQEFSIPDPHLQHMIHIARKKAILHHRILALHKIQILFHYWHVIHKPFAIIMLIIMAVHVGVTVLFGYRWVF